MPNNVAAAYSPSGSELGGVIQSPELSKSGKPTQRSVKDAGMARDIINTLIQANRNRQIVNGRIMAKYNAERPYSQTKLEEEGLGWRSNFTTKPLPQMIEKVAPRFVEAVKNLKYFTNSALPNEYQNATEKTEKFRSGITTLIQTRKGWLDLLEDVAQDNALFGYTILTWLDEFSWFPMHFRQDEIFISDGTKQAAHRAQVVLVKEVYLPHELYAQIKDKEAAEAVGWNVQNTIAQINKATPEQLRDNLSTSGSTEAWYQNAFRELTVGSSYLAGVSVITVYSLLVREVSGKISHYRLGGTELAELFSREDRFDSMEDCVAFFAFQKGNGTMHGSKGVGRDIYEMAGMLDRIRNEVVDRSIMAGKTLFQGDIKQIHKFKMSVIGSAVVVPTGWTVLEQRIDGNTEPFLRLDAYFSLLVDQLIGSVSPRLLQGERVTKAQVDLFASREEEGKDNKISRFLEFFVTMVGTMQRRACSPDVVGEDAKRFQKEMLKVMSREELDFLAKQPVAATIRDLTPQQRQLIVAVSNEKRGNPLYNQKALEIEDLTARVGAEFAKKVLLPENDPTVSAEQQRLQQMELALLLNGQPVPVSPRDNHEIHISILLPVLEQTATAITQGQTGTNSFKSILEHLNEHVNRALEQGVPKETLAPAIELLKKGQPLLAELERLDQQADLVQDQSAALDAEVAGGGLGSVPMG